MHCMVELLAAKSLNEPKVHHLFGCFSGIVHAKLDT
jgi:hypothetical protein